MKYCFDELIDRKGTASVKVDGMAEIWGRADLIPMWVADMDFATPPFVLDAVRHRCDHPVLGYTSKPESYFRSIVNWVKKRYDMEVSPDQITFVPGVVAGLGMAIHAFTSPGDKIMIMTPVYPPFSWLVTRNGRRLVECPLILENGHYRMDLERMRREIKGVKVLILCNPHNPGGVVWTREELQAVADLCAEDNVLVFSDEIHADLTLPPHRHTPFAIISERARQNSVTFMAPSKTFNMPGVAASHAIIYNDAVRRRLTDYLESSELGAGHVFAWPAVEAAYTHGEEWLEQCLSYLQSNIGYALEFFETHIPLIRPLRPMASYLLWLDCRPMHLSQEELKAFFADEAGLALNDGATFGKEGVGFMRMNVACPRAVLEKALNQLKAAFDRRFPG